MIALRIQVDRMVLGIDWTTTPTKVNASSAAIRLARARCQGESLVRSTTRRPLTFASMFATKE
jgi:hypothetical protein